MDRKILFLGVLFAAAILAFAALHGSGAPAGSCPAVAASGPVSLSATTIYFFYGEECSHCHTVMPLVMNLTEKYPGADIRILEVWHNETNAQLWGAANAAAGLEDCHVPEAVYGTTALVGSVEISEKFEGLLREYLLKNPGQAAPPK